MESGDAGDFENRLLGPTNLTALGSDSSKLLSGLLTALRQTGGHTRACRRSAAIGGIGAARTCQHGVYFGHLRSVAQATC